MGICQDITEPKEVELQLRETNASLERELETRKRIESDLRDDLRRAIQALKEATALQPGDSSANASIDRVQRQLTQLVERLRSTDIPAPQSAHLQGL